MYMEINDCRCKNSSDDNVVFYADNSDDNDLIVGENYSKFYDVVAKLQGMNFGRSEFHNLNV